ncbi:uridine kinase [Microbacteriaceae bacterium SG_E_30_P1]|uniref:Uridine kinase n=1 Tax=Antiquaquibacter oligotrophicus TaxID=2880260 RepID=A0ABT6KND1_9MICO|nr:ATP-binding protein [Antiquaquibacter oligotrophicus]MDH6181301.1 uridine kinase [Antiquaquibacter oligotrophicus]UDF13006.1 ATP-binding protein [Antiquaquibacter oligotrophicus]
MDVTLIDGRSGSGKSDLASLLVSLDDRYQLVRLDDVYPGWDGLLHASLAVPRMIDTLQWQAWDWAGDQPGARHTLDPDRPLIIEGVGALSRESRRRASTALWLEADDTTRRSRALARDGETFRPHWERWAAQERAFIEREHPQSLADVTVVTAAAG